jgi:hypothetical protein
MKLTQTIICFAILFLTSTQVYGQDEYNLDETYQIDREGTIYLSSNDAEVSIEGSNRSDVRLVIYRYVDVDGINIGSSGSFRMDVEQRGGDLYIQENNSENRTMFIGSVDEEYRITLEVPRNLALDLKGDDDSYEISNTNGAISINADDSDIELSEVTGEDFDFDLDDGNISIDEARGKLKLSMDDGELNVGRAEFTEIDASLDDGELDITTSLADGGLYLFDFDDGDLELNITGGGGEFDIHHDDRNISVDNNFEEVSSDDERSVYRLAGGDARIEINTDDGNIELRTM